MEPIYCTNGEWVAVYSGGHLFNIDGEWLGFIVERQVYTPQGKYLGFLSDDRRLLRKRVLHDKPAQREPPPAPQRPPIPASMPLAPLLRELPYHIIDVFEEAGERLMYISETRPDME